MAAPSDATKTNSSAWISNNDIVENIRAIPAKRILLISDGCYSGKMFYKMRDIIDNTSTSILEHNKMKSRRAITSGALETVPDKSVVMQYLCDYLQNNQVRWLSSKKLYMDIKR